MKAILASTGVSLQIACEVYSREESLVVGERIATDGYISRDRPPFRVEIILVRVHPHMQINHNPNDYSTVMTRASQTSTAKGAFENAHAKGSRAVYRGNSLIRNILPLGPYSMPMPRAPWLSWGVGLFLCARYPCHSFTLFSQTPHLFLNPER